MLQYRRTIRHRASDRPLANGGDRFSSLNLTSPLYRVSIPPNPPFDYGLSLERRRHADPVTPTQFYRHSNLLKVI